MSARREIASRVVRLTPTAHNMLKKYAAAYNQPLGVILEEAIIHFCQLSPKVK